eukprot:1533981-Prymnesium_polylepis.1
MCLASLSRVIDVLLASAQLVAVARNGELSMRVLRTQEVLTEQCQSGVFDPHEIQHHAHRKKLGDGTGEDESLIAHELWQRPVRYYVATVHCECDLIVHDGRDDEIAIYVPDGP